MRIYAETNYLLELILRQEQWRSCQELLTLCRDKSAELAIPAFCVPESFYKLEGRRKRRNELAQRFLEEQRELLRSSRYSRQSSKISAVGSLLGASGAQEEAHFHRITDQILNVARLVSCDSRVISRALNLIQQFPDLSLFDSIVLSSVVIDLEQNGGPACFLNKNKKDFDDPDVVRLLAKLGCKILFSFDHGRDFLIRPGNKSALARQVRPRRKSSQS